MLDSVALTGQKANHSVSHCRTSVRFLKTSEIGVPMVQGILRPTILLPDSLLDEQNEVSLKQSLAHEWKHIANSDLITWQLVTYCQILLWCQPFYWSLRKTLRLNQDQLADDYAVQACNATADYAETLLTFSKSNQLELHGALAMAGRKSDLYQRVEFLLNKDCSVASFSRKRIVASFAVAMTVVCFLLCSIQLTHAVAQSPTKQDQTTEAESQPEELPALTVKVTDANADPLSKAKVTVLDWVGTFEEIGAGVSDMSGEVTVSDIKFKSYAYMMVSAPGYAKTMQMLNLEPGKTTAEVVKMTPPVNGWIRIKSEDGKPVVGAEIQRLDFTDINGYQTTLNPSYGSDIGFVFSASDNEGRLNLPVVPEKSTVTVWVVHPDWKSKKLEVVEPKSEKWADLTLESGPKVKVKFYSNDLTQNEINSLTAKIDLSPFTSGGSRSDHLLRHQFPIKEGQITVTAHPEQHDEINIEIEGYFVTPQFRIYPNAEPRLNLENRDESEFKVLIRKPVKAKGRVVNSDGTPRPNVWVTGSSAPLKVDSVENGVVKTSVTESAGGSIGDALSDSEGKYEIDAVVGDCSVQVIEEGVFAKPLHTKFEVTDSEGETTIPDIKLYPIPKLRGQVIGASGDPVANAVVRMTSLGQGGADPVSATLACQRMNTVGADQPP